MSLILKSKEKILAAHCSNKNPIHKRARKSSQDELNDALLQWFKQTISMSSNHWPNVTLQSKRFGKNNEGRF